MPTPQILLIRHVESNANVDPKSYIKNLDYKVPISHFGHSQAIETSKALDTFFKENPKLSNQKILFYYSPYLRTRQTKDTILTHSSEFFSRANSGLKLCEEPLLAERSRGSYLMMGRNKELRKDVYPNESRIYEGLRENGGYFYARPPNGESLADTTNRMEIFTHKMLKYAEKHEVKCVVIIGHSEALKCLEKVLCNQDIEWLYNAPIMSNGEIKLIEENEKQELEANTIFQGKKRNHYLPKDFKIGAYEGSTNVKKNNSSTVNSK